MSESGSEDRYGGAIADLQLQRLSLEAQIATVDTAINALKALQSGASIPAGAPPGPSPTFVGPKATTQQPLQIEVDTFHNLTTSLSIKKYLAMRGRKPATTQEIVEALKAGGQSGGDGANFAVVVNNSLNRMSAADGEVSKVRKGIWGLKSWYSSKASSAD